MTVYWSVAAWQWGAAYWSADVSQWGRVYRLEEQLMLEAVCLSLSAWMLKSASTRESE